MKKLAKIILLSALFINVTLPIVCFSQVEVSPDGLGSIWAISGSKVEKLNHKGITTCEYSNRIFGEPTHIDASDPFRVLIFYNLPQIIVVLNSNAEELGIPFQLNMLRLGSIELVCRSSQGGFWAYSTFKNRLFHVDNSFALSGQQVNLGRLKQNTNPQQILETNGEIYISYENKYIARMDLYGDNLQSIEVSHLLPFAIYGNELWVSRKGKTVSHSLSGTNNQLYELNCNCINLPVINQTDTVCVSNKKIFRCQKKAL